MSASQPDFGNAVDFVNSLFKSGVTVLRATRDFTVQGKSYPAGSLVVKTAQAFRPHVMDMFEPQDYPDDFPYPGAPPTRPYDDAGYTLAFQMGVQFDRILEGFDLTVREANGSREAARGRDQDGRGSSRVLLQPSGDQQLHRDQSTGRGW